jgi:hypothetical protein
MAKDPFSFNFGFNRKPRAKKKKTKSAKKRASAGTKSNAWRKYVSNAPIPD